jgi:hypothetical protein
MSADSAPNQISISRTAFTEAFFAFEKQLPVSAFVYNRNNIGPLVRRFVMYDFFRAQHDQDLDVKNAAGQNKTAKLPASSFQPLVTHRDYKKRLNELAADHHGKVLFFFSSTQKPSDIINERGYFRHIDPYFERLASEFDAVRIQVSGSNSLILENLEYPVHTLNSGNLVMETMRKEGFKRKLKLKPSLANIKKNEAEIIAKIKALNAGYIPSQGSITAFAERVFAWEKLLIPFIEKLKPKAVFMPCYFCDQQTLGLTAACHKAGVPVIDIQHGGQDNPMYYGWEGAAAASPFLANYFWMWSDYFTEFIAANNSGIKGKPFTGGNFWMQKSLKTIQVTDEVKSLQSEAAKAERTVVISLQRGIAGHILEAMRELPSTWRWLIRFHPVQTEDERKIINDLLAEFPNAETVRPSKVNLYHLLQLADVHITGWSTVAIEALQLGVPTIFSHPNAEAGYGRLIGKDGLMLETGKEGMIAALKTAKKVSVMPLLGSNQSIDFPPALLKALNRKDR